MKRPKIITGGKHTDERGTVYYNNLFDLEPIRRFHILEHHDTDVFRGWHGHQYESKWFQVIKGAFNVFVVEPDDWSNPSVDLEVIKFTLSVNENEILHVPNGFATGFKALVPQSQLAVFSDKTLEESKLDDFRYNQEHWIIEHFKK